MLKVSVIITAYNRPHLLGDAIKSVLSQTYPIHELIVVDDCSPTSLEGALEPYKTCVTFKRLGQNSGASSARNHGIGIATGDLIAFLDDDDIWKPEKLAKQVAAMSSAVEACLCGYEFESKGDKHILPITQVDEAMLRLGNEICGTSGLLVRRKIIAEIDFDPKLNSGQDWDVYVRLSFRRPLVYVPEALFVRRYGHLGMTTNAAYQKPEELEKDTAALKKHSKWLGKNAYRTRLAAMLLKYIGQRERKSRFIVYAIRKAGARAVFSHFLRKALINNYPRRSDIDLTGNSKQRPL